MQGLIILSRVIISYINNPRVLKRLQSSKQWFTKRSIASSGLTNGEAAKLSSSSPDGNSWL
jgi:hypothetical protein